MESEDFFLWVVYSLNPKPPQKEDGRTLFSYLPIIRRVLLQKPERAKDGVHNYKRVPVDFDPMEYHIGYVVTIHARVRTEPDDGSDYVKKFYFPTITKSQEEANEIKVKLENGSYKNFLEKNEKFHEVTIHPSVIMIV
jgi:hypothetical protein